ncbi:tRNA (adenosine(37)-N6)-dimethylallyltransferase MiaA [Sediminibacter sp. Hel_I_10]|uniref:tRNA (adenosine(37)-N6)-dimethylallyltransferase MiaA n=1 Tax=Sediminibacter sp. Hel_I_10 TaxID=1392490 RepID=UPI001E5CB651|nr:tRNA (adenosine(37)-N6)-dimethylallyltransferase MiaA [Sediminibacter sp. Hel_I_10]
MLSFAIIVAIDCTMMSKYLIAIVGPTAIGKTALSIKLANYFNTEIISADSRQFYREMSIGTAAPTKTELASAPHHFIHHKSIEDNYSVGAFERDAIAQLDQLFKTRPVVIMVGGSGLYVDAVTKGLDEFPEVNPKIRPDLNEKLQSEGLEALQFQLKQLDTKAYETIAIDNPHRVIRALEVSISSGKPYSSFLTSETKQRTFETITIGVTADRELIYDRINNRVDVMIKDGLVDEVEALLPKKQLNALNTVAYKELFNVLEGEWDLEFAISEIKKNTRRFAKRQLTWFKRNKDTLWFDTETDINQVIEAIELAIKA